MGEIKKGKSSLINALLNEQDLLPTDSDIATSTVFKILYGPEKRCKVFFYDELDTGDRLPPKSVDADELMEYGTEKGNPGNEKRVEFISIELPNPMLQSGLVIVDTPGVGGLYKEHREITWRYAPNADAILFVVDSVDSVISSDEILFLKELTSKFTRKIVFVQTKIDNASEELWRAWEVRNKGILQSELGLDATKLLYFPVSAKIKSFADEEQDLEELIDSGFPSLMHFLTKTLIPVKAKTLAAKTASHLRHISQKIQHELDLELALACETTSSQLRQIETQRRDAITRFSRWESDSFKPISASATEQLSQVRRDALGKLEDLLNPVGKMLTGFVQQYENAAADELQRNASSIQRKLMETCGLETNKVFEDFVSEYKRLAENVQEQLMPSMDSDHIHTPRDKIDVGNHETRLLQLPATNAFETTRNVAFGGFSGLALGSTALGIVSAAFPPAAGLSFVAYACAVYGAKEIFKVMGARRNSQAFGSLRSLLGEQLALIRRAVTRHFEDKIDECTKEIQRLLESAVKQTRDDLQRHLDDAKAAASRSSEESREHASKVRGIQQKLQNLVGELKSLEEGGACTLSI